MAMEVKIHKKLGEYELDVHWKSTKKRIGILGASGSGKSLTLKSIAGIEHPDQGHIQIGDHVLYDSDSRICLKPQKRNVGYMFQNYALFPTMTVEQNVGAGLAGNKKKKQEQVQKMIRHFRLEGLEKRLPRELSGGQQQRVALARIMAYEPSVILLDEPFSALDVFLKDRLQQEMMELLSDYDGTVILVSHSRDEIYRFSEELLVIDDGKQICYGDTKAIFDCPEQVEAARLTGCKNIVRVKGWMNTVSRSRTGAQGFIWNRRSMQRLHISGFVHTNSSRCGAKEKITAFRLKKKERQNFHLNGNIS